MSEARLVGRLVPDVLFFEDNRPVIDAAFRQLEHDFPGGGAGSILDPNSPTPSAEAMSWMWARLMGRQHGSTEGFEGKFPITRDKEGPYWPIVSQLHYGDLGFTTPHLADPNKAYSNGLVIGGFPHELISRLSAIFGERPQSDNVAATTLLVGQRLRWRGVKVESSVEAIYEAVANQSGVDVARLRERSPWIRAEEAKPWDPNDEWSGPFATEYEIGRLAAEAFFSDLIDWKNYDVEIVTDPNPEEKKYYFREELRAVPPRDQVLATYHLRNGTRVNVLNAVAVARALGVPRPTSDSQTGEIVSLGLLSNSQEAMAIATNLPHVRAGLDVSIRLLKLAGSQIADIDIATPPLLPDQEALTALGEIPATHKADLRLRAVLAGQDPDAPELAQL